MERDESEYVTKRVLNLRPELYKQNSEKVFNMVNQIRNETGIEMTPNSLVNFLVEHAEGVEVTQVVKIRFGVEPPEIPDGNKRKKVQVESTNKVNWVTDFK